MAASLARLSEPLARCIGQSIELELFFTWFAVQEPVNRRIQLTRDLLLGLAFSVSLAACGGDGADTGADASTPADASAPADAADCTTSTLTYANFGEQFFADFCTTCHSSTSLHRNGAPASKNWDTLEQVMADSVRIQVRAGLGTSMPPSAVEAIPTAEDRAKLAEWIDCGTM
tara:strand:- start:71201 stop:71719 length:519 start_codon:yes stop_codon:yes gene_type:complete